MADNIIASDRPRRNWPRLVILAGLGGGGLDFIDASVTAVNSGKSMLKPWQGIAQVWLGRLPDKPNFPAACLGIASHFAIATIMAAVLALAMSRIPALRRQPIFWGLIYGVGLYLVMLGIVMPILVPGHFFLWNGVSSIHGLAVHMAVGLIMAIIISRRSRRTDGLLGR